MTFHLSFLTAVALAGLAYLTGVVVERRWPIFRHYFIPEPLLGGLIFGLVIFLLRVLNIRLEWTTSGPPVDFLVALLTTNMGLHLTPRVLRQGWRILLLYVGLAGFLFVAQLVAVLPAAVWAGHPLPAAILFGPLSFIGAPYNLNPPAQTGPIAGLFQPAYPELELQAQGIMMMGIIAAVFLSGIIGRRLFQRARQMPPRPSLEERQTSTTVWGFAIGETAILILILTLIATAFILQRFLLQQFGWLSDDILPVIVLSFLIGGTFRLLFETVVGENRFPQLPLNVLLFGPTMSIVLTFAIISAPFHTLTLLSGPMILGGILAITTSVVVAWLAFALFARLTDRYYAAVVSVAFLAITTGWGPVAMAYLRRFSDEEGPVPPMPAILPLNAFYIFPWLVILMTRLFFQLLG